MKLKNEVTANFKFNSSMKWMQFHRGDILPKKVIYIWVLHDLFQTEI